jgi:hypothetical protein
LLHYVAFLIFGTIVSVTGLQGLMFLRPLFITTRALKYHNVLSIVIMILSLILLLWPILYTPLATNIIQSLWTTTRSKGRAIMQDLFLCCGLNSPGERAEDSAYCPVTLVPDFANTTDKVSCIERTKDVRVIFGVIIGILLTLSLGSIIATCLSLSKLSKIMRHLRRQTVQP